MNKKYQRYIEYIVNDIEPPYLKSIEPYGLKDNECVLVLSKVFNQPVTIKVNSVNDKLVYDSKGNAIYFETSDGDWSKYEYDTNGNEIYSENSNGFWVKQEYDTNGNEIYYENSSGDWAKREYDTNGNEIYWENGDGAWIKKEYDTNGNKIYYETSYGYIRDNR